MPFVILVLQNIHIVVHPPFEHEWFLIFYTDIYIRHFKNGSYESFLMATFSAIMIGVRGNYKNTNNDDHCQVIVTYEIEKKS